MKEHLLYSDFLICLRNLVIIYSHSLHCIVEKDRIVIYLTDKRIREIVKSVFKLFKDLSDSDIYDIYFIRDYYHNHDYFVIRYKEFNKEEKVLII